MREVDNEILKDPRLITKSQINKKTLKEMCMPNCSVKEVKQAFDDYPDHKLANVGNPYNENQQRNVRFITKYELFQWVIKGRYIPKS